MTDHVKRGRGQPRHQPTEKTRAEVLALASYGTPQEQIADYIGIDRKTLEKWYREELTTASTKANAAVARSLYQQAVNGGNVTAMIFWLKTRARWREVNHLDVSSTDGTLSPPRIIEVVAGGGNGGSGED